MMAGLVRELAFQVAGHPLPVEAPTRGFVVLGEDRVGNQESLREGFRPVFVFMVLMMELFAMASLIAKEIQERTVVAVLVTPASVGDVLAAKGIAGALSGLVQAVIVLAAVNSLWPHPGLLLTLLLLGSVMVAGTAMLAGSSGRDFMSTLFWGMAFVVPLLIPALAALFPGTASAWIRALPSYPLIRGLVDVAGTRRRLGRNAPGTGHPGRLVRGPVHRRLAGAAQEGAGAVSPAASSPCCARTSGWAPARRSSSGCWCSPC